MNKEKLYFSFFWLIYAETIKICVFRAKLFLLAGIGWFKRGKRASHHNYVYIHLPNTPTQLNLTRPILRSITILGGRTLGQFPLGRMSGYQQGISRLKKMYFWE